MQAFFACGLETRLLYGVGLARECHPEVAWLGT